MKPYTDIEQAINYSYYFSCKQNIHSLLCSSAKKGRRERPRQGEGEARAEEEIDCTLSDFVQKDKLLT